MGSLSSTPKIPAQRQAAQAPALISPTLTPKISPVAKTDDASEAREKTLLARKRGRIGTIATSLKGLLSEARPDKRKTLLGE